MEPLLAWLLEHKMAVLIFGCLLAFVQIITVVVYAWTWHSYPIARVAFTEGHLVWVPVILLGVLSNSLFVLFVERVLVPMRVRDETKDVKRVAKEEVRKAQEEVRNAQKEAQAAQSAAVVQIQAARGTTQVAQDAVKNAERRRDAWEAALKLANDGLIAAGKPPVVIDVNSNTISGALTGKT